MDDRLQQAYRTALIPGFDEVCDAARESGALGCCLSGAGPTILALAPGNAEPVARAMEDEWKRRGVVCRAEVTDIDDEGLVVEYLDDWE